MDPEFVNHAPSHLRQARQELRKAIELADKPSPETERLEVIEQEIFEIEERAASVDFE